MSHSPNPQWRDPLPEPLLKEEYDPQAPSLPKTRTWINVLMLVLTVITTVMTGLTHAANYDSGYFLDNQIRLWGLPFVDPYIIAQVARPIDWMRALGFSFCILAILLAHEMGHYLYCRYYRIRATLPYVIPVPIFFGTMGAVIRIREPFRNRRQLFDVGIGGPIAGFVVLIPVLVLAMLWSSTIEAPSPEDGLGLVFAVPLLFDWVGQWLSPLPEGHLWIIHPIGWAALFGALATSINLLPIGQLDGGHIVYALFGRRWHRIISHAGFFGLIGLSIWSWPVPSYLLFALLVRVFGFRHPPPLQEEGSPGRKRALWAVAAALIFVLTFIPVPVRFG
ncbi:MAG TPA: site-2 protease family protein [Acidobacteriota bacterium]|nr:site-2 protease family protein [Acidobacteriota bacterium]